MSCIVPGLVKIGKTANYRNRMYIIKHNGYVNVTGFKEEYAIEVDDYDEKESELHDYFKEKQIGNTELYAITPEYAISIMAKYDGKQIFPDPKLENKKTILRAAEEDIKSSKLKEGLYTIKSKSYNATLEVCNGILTLKKGSMINTKPTESFKHGRNQKNPKLWKMIMENYVYNGILTDDVIVSNVSSAACVVLGRSVNGWKFWIDEYGQLIDNQRKLVDK